MPIKNESNIYHPEQNHVLMHICWDLVYGYMVSLHPILDPISHLHQSTDTHTHKKKYSNVISLMNMMIVVVLCCCDEEEFTTSSVVPLFQLLSSTGARTPDSHTKVCESVEYWFEICAYFLLLFLIEIWCGLLCVVIKTKFSVVSIVLYSHRIEITN